MKLIIDKLEFRRIILTVTGHFEGISGSEDIVLYFQEQRGDKRLFFDDVNVGKDKFNIRINVLEICNEAPVPSGRWYLCADIGEEKGLPAYVSDRVYDRIYLSQYDGTRTDLQIDYGQNNYWHGFSRLAPNKWQYYLHVDYEIPELIEGFFPNLVYSIKTTAHRAYRKVMKQGFQTFFNLCNRHIKKNGRRVFFTSARSAQLSGNEKFVYERMLERGLDKKYDISFDFRSSITSHRSFKNKFEFTYKLATADFIFCDDYQPELYTNDYNPGVKIIQLWHACGAFKTIGFERIGGHGAPAFTTRIHKCYTHVPVSSDHSADHNAEAFSIDRRKFYPVGVPRTDVFFDEEYKAATRKKIMEAYPLLKDAGQVIMYAPTFRGVNARDAYFPMQMINFHKLGTILKKNNQIMLIKMHPFVRQKVDIPEEFRDYFIDMTSYPDINELLMITDVLITDYSSVIYEAALLRLPMLFYAFDLESYVDDRGFYEPYEDIVPGKIVKTQIELLRTMEENDYRSEKLDDFLKKNFNYLDGHATDRVIDLIFGNGDGNSRA